MVVFELNSVTSSIFRQPRLSVLHSILVLVCSTVSGRIIVRRVCVKTIYTNFLAAIRSLGAELQSEKDLLDTHS